MDRALDHCLVAWALRGTVAQRAALRLQLRWIAVSGEDDKPHRPVNVPAPPYEQYEVVVRTPIGRRLELGVATRYLVASLEEGPVASTGIAPRRAPHDLIPHIPQITRSSSSCSKGLHTDGSTPSSRTARTPVNGTGASPVNS